MKKLLPWLMFTVFISAYGNQYSSQDGTQLLMPITLNDNADPSFVANPTVSASVGASILQMGVSMANSVAAYQQAQDIKLFTQQVTPVPDPSSSSDSSSSDSSSSDSSSSAGGQ